MDAEIRIGDVCLDLAQASLVQVVGFRGTVEEHAEQDDGFSLAEYKANPLFEVDDSDAVWKCVYLQSHLKNAPSAAYDFPESRLARVPVEEANEDIQRVQETIEQQLITETKVEGEKQG